MNGPRIVLWRPMYDPDGYKLLESQGAVVETVDSPKAEDVIAALSDAKALWVRTPERVTEAVLDAGESLIVVSSSGFGTDNIDVAGATERGILVVHHEGFGRVPVSEHGLMLLLAAAKRLIWSDQSTRDGSAWNERSGLELFELEGKTVGIVGVGYIGSELARKLRVAFGCRVLGYDPFADARLVSLAGVHMHTDLHGMLGRCEFLCLCAALTDSSRNIIGTAELAALPMGAVVVNVARGQLLDLDALLEALESGHVRAAGLDVVYPEPLGHNHPLLRHPKVVLSPHTAGLTVEASVQLAQSAADQIFAALGGRLPAFTINPEAWDGPSSRRPLGKRG